MKIYAVRKIAISAMFIAIGILLPFFTGQFKQIGNMLLPMHMPVLICGFVCGWQCASAVGFITPILRAFLFGMPPMYPNAIAMAFELMTYGLVVAIIYKLFKKKSAIAIYTSLIMSMLIGRMIWGISQLFFLGIKNNSFTWNIFVTRAFINTIPGILLQIIIIPVIVYSYEKNI